MSTYPNIINGLKDEITAMNELNQEMYVALKAFLRAPSPGSDGPGLLTLEVTTFNMDAARAAIAKAEGTDKVTGQDAYEADCLCRPTYHDGTPRKTWTELGDLERSTWIGPAFEERNEMATPCGSRQVKK